MDDDDLITAWRQATIAPTTADEAELELRRIIETNEREAAEFFESCRSKTRPINRGVLDHMVFVLGQEVSLSNQLAQRFARKADYERQTEIEQMRNHVKSLERRVADLEKKAAKHQRGAL